MNEIEKVMAIKDLLKRLGMLYDECCMNGDFRKCDGHCDICVKAIGEVKKTLQGLEEGMVDIAPEILKAINKEFERPLSFSKRLAISRMFNSWFNKNPEHSRYGIDMLLVSYLDKKGWLNTQKIRNQMTDSRIKAVLGEEVGEKLINDDKSKDNIEIIRERLNKIKKKHHIENKEE